MVDLRTALGPGITGKLARRGVLGGLNRYDIIARVLLFISRVQPIV